MERIEMDASKATDCVEKSNKCNQYNYASKDVGHLRRHLKTHSQENEFKFSPNMRFKRACENVYQRRKEQMQPV